MKEAQDLDGHEGAKNPAEPGLLGEEDQAEHQGHRQLPGRGKRRLEKGYPETQREARGRQRLSEAAGRRSHGRGRAAPGGRSCQETAEQT